MFNKIRKIFIFALAICSLCCFVVGCNTTTKQEYVPSALVLNKTQNTLNIGQAFKLYVIDSQNLKLIFRSEDTGIAEVMQDGTVIATGAGETKITVEALDSNIPKATCSIKVLSSNGARLVKFDVSTKNILVGSDFEVKATVYSEEGELNVLPEFSYFALETDLSVNQIISVEENENTLSIKGLKEGCIQIVAKIDDSVATLVVKVVSEALFEAEELMIEPFIKANTIYFNGFPNIKYFLNIDGEDMNVDFENEGDLFSLYLPEYFSNKVNYYQVKVGYKYKENTCYSKTLDYDTESIGIYNGFVGSYSNNNEYIGVELNDQTVVGEQGKSLKVTAKPNKISVPMGNRSSLSVSFINHTNYTWADGVNQVSWKVYLDSESFVNSDNDKIDPTEYITEKNEAVNILNTMKYDMALLGDNPLCIDGLSNDTFISISNKGADRWMKFTLNIAPDDFDKFFTIDEKTSLETFSLAMFNTNGFLGYVVDETSDYIKSTGLGYSFYIDDMSFVSVTNDEFDNTIVGSAQYFAVELDSLEDYDSDGSSLKIIAKPHTDHIAQDKRSTDTAVYIPYKGNKIDGNLVVTWKAKVNKESFNKIDGSEASINYTNFYANALLTNNAVFFGENDAKLSYGIEDNNGWITYTLSIPEKDVPLFILEVEGSKYFKLVSMNTSMTLYNTGSWVGASLTGYEFNVDKFEFFSGNDKGAHAGSGAYFAVGYSTESKFITNGEEYSTKISAKAHSDNIGINSRETDTAIFIPVSDDSVLKGGIVTVTWMSKLDKTSFYKLDGSVANINYTNFYKNAMLTNNATFFGENSAVISCTAEDSNGWVKYSLVIPEEERSLFFIEKDGMLYLKLVCMNTSMTLYNSGSWVGTSNTGYDFYVCDFDFSRVSGEFAGSFVGNIDYFAVSYSDDENFTTDSNGQSLKITAKTHSDNIGSDVRSKHTAIYLPYTGGALTDGVVTVNWKVKLDKSSFIKLDGSVATVNYTNFYKNALLTNNATWFGANNATLNCTVEDVNGWITYSLSISEEDFDKFFVEKDGSIYFKLVCMNTMMTIYNTGNWVATSETGYDFYVDELTFSAVNGEFVGAKVGSSSYFALEYSDSANFTTDSSAYSLKVTAKAHTDSIGTNQRGKVNAIYIPYNGEIPKYGAVVTWKAKVDKNSFKKLDDSIPTIDYTSFYKNGMLTNNVTWFGNPATGVGTLTNSSEDANGWVTYTLTLTKEQISTFFTNDGLFKLVCMNTGAVLFNNGSWTSPTSTGYEFYVDEINFTPAEAPQPKAGSSMYFAVEYYNNGNADSNFDANTIKVSAKAHSDGIGAQQRGKDNAIYIPYDGSVPTNGAVITWKAKVDKNSFVKLDESVPTINYTSFYKNGMLTNNVTWFGNPATGVGTLTNSNEDANGWVTYTLTITKEQISTFFTEDGYFKLVCMNTGAVLFNNGNWTSSTSTGYEFYVSNFVFTVNE